MRAAVSAWLVIIPLNDVTRRHETPHSLVILSMHVRTLSHAFCALRTCCLRTFTCSFPFESHWGLHLLVLA